MPTVKKDIQETSKKISQVKKIVKKRVEALEYGDVQQTPISAGTNWKENWAFISFLYGVDIVGISFIYTENIIVYKEKVSTQPKGLVLRPFMAE